jgi:hypothetical protein
MGISLGLKLKDRVHEKDRLTLKKEAVIRFASINLPLSPCEFL